MLREVNVYKTEKIKPRKTLLEKTLAIKAIIRSVVDLKRNVIVLETQKGVLIKTHEELVDEDTQRAC